MNRFQRRLGPPRVGVLLLLRVTVVTAGWLWLLLAPQPLSRLVPLVWTMSAFSIYSTVLLGAFLVRPARTLRCHLPVLVGDLGSALVMIYFSAGAHSTLYLALLLIVAVEAYYDGLTRGLTLSAVSGMGYVATVWTTVETNDWADLVLRIVMLTGTALGVGLIGELERAERLEVQRLGQEAAEREVFIRDVVDSVAEGLIVLGAGCRVVLLNAAVEERHGIVGSTAVGRPFFTVFPEWGATPVAAEIDRLLQGTAPRFVIRDVEHRGPTGERGMLDIGGTVFRRAGQPAGVVIVTQEVTERVTMEQSARRAEKLAALGTLAAGLAHELNNPIGIIVSRIEVVLMEAESRPSPPALLDDLRVLHRHAMRVARIVRSLLSFARPGPGEHAPVDLNHVVEETLVLAEKQVGQTGIRITRLLASGLPPIRGDAVALQQVVLNLLLNARDAIPAEGEIRIETCTVPDRPGLVQLTVSDTGGGIAAEALPRIFDPFYTSKPAGTGLGLSVSHGIVRDHSGTIDVQSQPGVGTTVVLRFPHPAGASSDA